MKQNRYHTNIALACQQGLLDKSVLNKIPKSTRHNFKKRDYSNIFGAEFISSLDDNIELFKELTKSKKIIKACKAIIKIKNSLIKLQSIKKDKTKKKKTIISAIEKVTPDIDFKQALKFFNISKTTFHNWKFELENPCHNSFFKRCIKRWPGQLALKTIEKIKSIMENPLYENWPIVSIAAASLRNGELALSLGTWYKYCRLLNINRKRKKSKKKNKKGIRANAPGEILHADVTIFRTLDNVKHYIYLVVDNFSRAILSYKVSTELSAATRLDTIKEAYYNHRDILHKNNIDLIVDGGPENNNHTMDNFLNSDSIPIRKLVAGKDIRF